MKVQIESERVEHGQIRTDVPTTVAPCALAAEYRGRIQVLAHSVELTQKADAAGAARTSAERVATLESDLYPSSNARAGS